MSSYKDFDSIINGWVAQYNKGGVEKPKSIIERLKENWPNHEFVMSVYPDNSSYVIIDRKYLVNVGKQTDFADEFDPLDPWFDNVLGTVGDYIDENNI